MVKCPDGVEHPVLLRAREVLIDRKADHLPGMAVGNREAPGGIAQMSQALLPIERDRIVDLGLDAVIETVSIELVASFGEHHVEMVDVLHVVSARRHAYAPYAGQAGVVIG